MPKKKGPGRPRSGATERLTIYVTPAQLAKVLRLKRPASETLRKIIDDSAMLRAAR